MAGEIFYSQVNANLQTELMERAKAGKQSRTTKQLDFMLGKIANIELVAYKNQEHSIEDTANFLGVLGGKTVISNEYMPSRYLNSAFTYRRDIKVKPGVQSGGSALLPEVLVTKPNNYSSYTSLPYITACDITLNDTAVGAGITNIASVNITVPNPIQDLDYIESTFMRPGRAITLTVEYPDSAVISGLELSSDVLQFPTAQPKTKAQTNLKMNSAIYDMLVISFSMTYAQNGSVEITLHLRGTSGVYADVTSIITQPSGSSSTTKPLLETLYKTLHEDIHSKYKPGSNQTKTEIGSVKSSDFTKKVNGYSDKWWMVTFKNSTQYTYCTMGYLIEYINNNILQTKQKSITPSSIIVFNPKISKSKLIDDIVSGHPYEVMLDTADTYDTDKTWLNEPFSQLKDTRFRNFIIKDNKKDNKENVDSRTKLGYPSMIWINTKIIDDIEKSTPKDKLNVKYIIAQICDKIKQHSGNMINLQLSPNPSNLNELLLYDVNYINLSAVKPFSVPMTNLSPSGSIVKNFTVQAKLPPSSQALMYAINNSDVISENEIAPYVNYMYNNYSIVRTMNKNGLEIVDTISSDTATADGKKLQEDYKASFEKFKKELIEVKKQFIENPLNESIRSKLKTALQKRVQYPTPKLELSNLLTSPKYPHEISFTIDGINGFRYGDALQFDFLPARYKHQTTFSITSITHTVNDTGIWSTEVKCMMRPDFNN